MSEAEPSAKGSQLPVGVVVVLGALGFAAHRQGAYHEWQHLVFGALVAVGALALLPRAIRSSTTKTIGLAVAPLLASSLLSLGLAEDRSNATSTFVLIALIAAGLLAGAVSPGQHVNTVLIALTTIAVFIAATAIWGVATHSTPWGRITAGVWRGSSSLTYANAAAAVLGPVTLLATVRAAHTNNRWFAVAGVFTAVGFASTQSRGGALAFVIVALGLVVHLGVRRTATTGLPMLLGVGIGLPAVLLRSSVDAQPAPLLVVALLLLGLAATALTWPLRDRLPSPHLLLAGATAMSVALIAITPLRSAFGARLSLRSSTRFAGQDAQVLLGDRSNTWRVAFERFGESPIVGHGPGEVDLRWMQEGRSFSAIFVHNEYLELMVTHGAVGPAALVLSIVVLARALRFDASTAPFAFALAAFMIHSAFDFLWHIPMLPVFFAAVLGLWLGISYRSRRPDSRFSENRTKQEVYS